MQNNKEEYGGYVYSMCHCANNQKDYRIWQKY